MTITFFLHLSASHTAGSSSPLHIITLDIDAVETLFLSVAEGVCVVQPLHVIG
jgi:hypothetical protein